MLSDCLLNIVIVSVLSDEFPLAGVVLEHSAPPSFFVSLLHVFLHELVGVQDGPYEYCPR